MEVKRLRLPPISPEQIASPAISKSISQETIPSLQQLREIEKNIQDYKKKHEDRLKQCQERLDVVNVQYEILKKRDPVTSKQPKKGI